MLVTVRFCSLVRTRPVAAAHSAATHWHRYQAQCRTRHTLLTTRARAGTRVTSRAWRRRLRRRLCPASSSARTLAPSPSCMRACARRRVPCLTATRATSRRTPRSRSQVRAPACVLVVHTARQIVCTPARHFCLRCLTKITPGVRVARAHAWAACREHLAAPPDGRDAALVPPAALQHRQRRPARQRLHHDVQHAVRRAL